MADPGLAPQTARHHAQPGPGPGFFLRAAGWLLACGLVLGLLGGCAAFIPQSEALRSQWPADLADRAELTEVPFFAQDEYQCGPAALATVMAHRGLAVTPEALVPRVYLPARRGSLQLEMLAAPRRDGLVSLVLAPRLHDVLREVQAGNPVVVLQDYGVWPLPYWHYAVVVGFAKERGLAWLRSGLKPRQELPLPVLEYTWKPSEHWAMVVVPPERVPVTADEPAWLAAVHAMEQVAGADAAARGYASALQRWPDSVGAAIGLANTHYQQARLPAAAMVLRQALQQQPDAVLLLNNLAQVLFELGQSDEALALAERALAQPGPFMAAARATRDQILASRGASPPPAPR